MTEGEERQRRVDMAMDRIAKAEGRIEGHEMLCAQRYSEILAKMVQINVTLTNTHKIGLGLAALLFGIEFGKATFPAIFAAIMHVSP